MSDEKDHSKDESVPRVPEGHVEEEESSSSANDQGNIEVQRAESAGRNLGQEPPLEGAVGGEMDDADVVVKSSSDRKLIKAGKEDLFERFFSQEYTQVKAPILGRHRHKAQRQRHFSDGSVTSISDSNKLQPMHLGAISTGLVLNQAGAIVGIVPAGESGQFGKENGPALSGFGQLGEDSEHSIGSTETVPIGDVYAGNFPSGPLDSSRGLSPSSLPSLSSLLPTATSDDPRVSPPLDSELPSEDKRISPISADSESSVKEKPARQRRYGVAQLFPTSQSPDITDLEEGKLMADVSILSDVLPERKISKDSSNDSYDQMSLGDEAINYAHSVESDSCLPMPDLGQAAIEDCETLQTSAETDPDKVDQTVDQETTTERSPHSNGSPDA